MSFEEAYPLKAGKLWSVEVMSPIVIFMLIQFMCSAIIITIPEFHQFVNSHSTTNDSEPRTQNPKPSTPLFLP
jgi:hypothetical protein